MFLHVNPADDVKFSYLDDLHSVLDLHGKLILYFHYELQHAFWHFSVKLLRLRDK